jgi:(p)ppGpp synthase/HD superfamily hydrolase
MLLRFALSTGLWAATAALPAAALELNLDALAAPAASSLIVSLPDLAAESYVLARQVSDTTHLLEDLNIDGVVTSRQKSPYSVWMKMTRKSLAMDQVLDRLALRVRVDTVDECYALMDAMHDRYDTVPGEFDDYIASPKANGYASLHTVLQLSEGPVEVQVRTHATHDHAENGNASHDAYKRGQGFEIAA